MMAYLLPTRRLPGVNAQQKAIAASRAVQRVSPTTGRDRPEGGPVEPDPLHPSQAAEAGGRRPPHKFVEYPRACADCKRSISIWLHNALKSTLHIDLAKYMDQEERL